MDYTPLHGCLSTYTIFFTKSQLPLLSFSPSIRRYGGRVHTQLMPLLHSSPQVQDLYECRIIAFLNTMAESFLLDLPAGDTWTLDSFLLHSQVNNLTAACAQICDCQMVLFVWLCVYRLSVEQGWRCSVCVVERWMKL